MQLSALLLRLMSKNRSTMENRNDKITAFERFAAEHRRIIAKVCWMYAGDDSGWQDLCQEVLINLWRGFDTFERQSKASTWVWRVALNTCISCQRRDRRHNATLPLPVCAAMPDDEPLRTERLRELHELINRLQHLDRTIVMMWLDEYSYDEIASVTGLPRNSVASRLHRVKEKLARMAKQ